MAGDVASVKQIRAFPRRPDWFAVDPEIAKRHLDIPGLDADQKTLSSIVHRSFLPLIPEAALLLDDACVRSRPTDKNPTVTPGWTLRPYQHEAVAFTRARYGVLIADAMRLGKTAEAVASHDMRDGPIVVVGPLSARMVWEDWFRRAWPGAQMAFLRGRRHQVGFADGADAIFLNYDILPTWQCIDARKIGTLVFDECHLLSNRTSKRSKAAAVLTARARRVIGLSGSPLWNKPAGLWSILYTLNGQAWGSYWDFCRRYCDGHPGEFGFVADGTSNVDEFRARMAEVMIRRTWQDVRADVPQIERAVEVVEITKALEDKIDDAAMALRGSGGGSLSTAIGEIARLRRLFGKVKTDTAANCAENYLAEGESVVVWCWHRDVARALQMRLVGDGVTTFVVDGDTPSEDTPTRQGRRTLVERFRSTSQLGPCAMVITIGVGQTAIDLSCARHAIYCELDFTPATMAQSEMRTFSPDRPMTVTHVVVDHEIDRMLTEVLQRKCKDAETMGVPAADSALDVVLRCFGGGDSDSKPDMQRLMDAVLADAARALEGDA